MSVTLPYPTLGPGPVYNSELNENFGALEAKFGQIDNSDIASGAAISVDKLDAQYERISLKLSGSSTTTVNTFIDFAPLLNDGNGTWTIEGVQWLLNDKGTTRPAIRLRYGYYTADTTTWVSVSEITAATTLSAGGTDDTADQGTIALTASSLDPNPGVNPVRSIGLFMSTAGVASGTVWVSIMLSRKITAA